MKKKISILVVGIFLSLPLSLSYADWVDVSGVSSWQFVHDGKSILYQYGQPLCIVETYRGTFFSNSEIKFIKSDIQDWDKIIVDGEVHDVMKVTRL